MTIQKHPRQYGYVVTGKLYDGREYKFSGFTVFEAIQKAFEYIKGQTPVSITFRKTNTTFKLSQ